MLQIYGSLKTKLVDSSDVEYKLNIYGVNSVTHISSFDGRGGWGRGVVLVNLTGIKEAKNSDNLPNSHTVHHALQYDLNEVVNIT
jgi:hypothetical protein